MIRNTEQEPRLMVYQSTWGMIDLPTRENMWQIDEQFERIKVAGFDGIQQFILDVSDRDGLEAIFAAQRKFGLEFGVSCMVWNASEFLLIAEVAKANDARYINVMVRDYFVTGQDAIRIITEILAVGDQLGLPTFIETHRNTVTQDLLRTIDYVRAVGQMRLTLDLSHYILCTEIMASNDQVEAAFNELNNRADAIHARISNGHQIQVSATEFSQATAMFGGWWRNAMRTWSSQALPGDIFHFTVELGPPPYGIIISKESMKYAELYDRWNDALVLKNMARHLWSEAQAIM